MLQEQHFTGCKGNKTFLAQLGEFRLEKAFKKEAVSTQNVKGFTVIYQEFEAGAGKGGKTSIPTVNII